MKGANALVIGLVLAILVAAFVPLAVGEDDSLHVVMTVEDRVYSAGNNIVVELRIYDKGVLVDANGANDTVEIRMVRNWQNNNPIPIEITNDGTGIYRGSYTIGSYDDSDDHNLRFYYYVERGDPPFQDEEGTTNPSHHNYALEINVYEQEFTVEVTFDGQPGVVGHPGETVVATVRARLGSAYVGDSAFDNVMIEDPEGNTADLTAVWVSTGVCQVTYTLPATLTSGVYELSAEPSIAGGAHGSAFIVVNVLDIWYHKLSATGETVTFEVCVADLNGEPVNGASVLISRSNHLTHPLTGTSNATGKVLMTLTNVDGQNGIFGYVLAGGKNQTIEGAIFNPRPEEPEGDLDIIWNGNDYIFDPGQSVTLQYTAFYDEQPMNAQTIHYYVTATGTDYGLSAFGDMSDGGHVDAPYSVVVAGTETTTAIGQFSISFIAPADQSHVNVKFEIPTPAEGNQGDENDNLFYEVWGDGDWDEQRGTNFDVVQGNLVDDSLVKISGDKFKTGPENTVRVTMTTTPFDVVSAMWGIGSYNPDNPDAFDPAWFNWVPGGGVISLTQTTDTEYEGTYSVPVFLENEDTITVMAGYVGDSNGYPHYNMKDIARDTGGLSMLLIIGIIVILVIVVLVIYLIKR